MRTLTIVSRKESWKDTTPISNVAVDGKDTGIVVKAGQSVTVSLNENQHVVQCFFKYANNGKIEFSNSIEIPANDLHYKYQLQLINNSIFVRAFSSAVELVEDYEQSEYNRRILHERLIKQKQIYDEKQLRKKVDSLLDKEFDKKSDLWNIDMALSVLTSQERESNVTKEILRGCRNVGIQKAAEVYYSYEDIQIRLNPLKTVKEFKDEINNILKHENVLCDRMERIKSIFTDENSYLEKYKRIEELYLKKFGGYTISDEVLNIYMNRIQQISQAYMDKDYEKTVKLQMLCDTDLEEFYMLKELIVFSAMNPVPTKDDNMNTQALHVAYDCWISPAVDRLEGEETEFYPTVDRIIEKTIVLSRVNLIDNVMEDLKKTLEIIGGSENKYNLFVQDNSQFEVLRKVFEYYKAPKEEIAVLEAMFTYNIPRTFEQEQRLAFLKKGNSNAPKMYETRGDSNVFTYDYRVLQWSENDIRSYIDGFTMSSKIYDIPMVIDSFEKSVSVSSIKWDDEKMALVLSECVKENFGDKYGVCCVETATVMDGLNGTVPAIFITENKSDGKGYPWLGFLVVGDQITLKQLNLSIYSLYMPDKNNNSGSIMQDNEKIISEVVVAKMKQSPRLNNYIGTVTNIFVDTIEKWINNNVSSDIYN